MTTAKPYAIMRPQHERPTMNPFDDYFREALQELEKTARPTCEEAQAFDSSAEVNKSQEAMQAYTYIDEGTRVPRPVHSSLRLTAAEEIECLKQTIGNWEWAVGEYKKAFRATRYSAATSHALERLFDMLPPLEKQQPVIEPQQAPAPEPAHKYPLQRVNWLDSRQPSSSWEFLTDTTTRVISRCVSVGYLVHETDQSITLAQNAADYDQASMQVSGCIVISKRAITHQVNLQEGLVTG